MPASIAGAALRLPRSVASLNKLGIASTRDSNERLEPGAGTMVSGPCAVRRSIVVATIATACCLATAHAHAQTTLDAKYDITFGGIDVGKVTWSADIGPRDYTTRATGEAAGLLSILISGRASVSTKGVVTDGSIAPTKFVAAIEREDEKVQFTMTFANGMAEDVSSRVPASGEKRVPVTAADRSHVIDPLSAFLIVIPGDGNVLRKTACERTLPVFDGRRRFDLVLTFKRMDKVAGATGYGGPAVVCALRFKPIAGYRPDSRVVRYLTADRVIELWLVPLAAGRVVAPFRLLIDNFVGDIEIVATRFEATDNMTTRRPPAQ